MSPPWIAAFLSLTGLVVLLGVVTLGTLRRVLPILEEHSRAPLPPGIRVPAATRFVPRPMPDFEATTVDGKRVTNMDLSFSGTLLLFLDAACRACDALAADLEAGDVPALEASLVVVATDSLQALRFAQGRNVEILVDAEDHPLASAVGSDRYPDAFVIRGGQIVSRGNPNDWAGIRALLAGWVHPIAEAQKERVR